MAPVSLLFLASKDPLDLDVRRRIFQEVERFPGLHMREIARALEIHPNHAKYHLHRLESNGLVSSRREDGYWRFWPKQEGSMGMRDTLSRQDKTALAVLRRPVPLNVVLVLLDRTEASHGELLDEVDVSHSTLHYHLSKMEASGVVASRKDARRRVYRLCDPDHTHRLLLAHRPPKTLISRFLDAWEQVEAGPALQHVLEGRTASGRGEAPWNAARLILAFRARQDRGPSTQAEGTEEVSEEAIKR